MNAETVVAGSAPATREFRVTYDASLVEEAVLRTEAAMAGAERAAFRRERDRLYEVPEPDEREARFGELHGRWFSRLGLDRPLHSALAEAPDLVRRTRGCLVARAASTKEEAADLVGDSGPAPALPTLLVRLRPESLLEAGGLVPFLRHELAHVADMLEPAFGYERSLPASDGGPSYELLLRDRYRAVWCTTIEGRLFRRGLAGARGSRLREFARAFPMLGEGTEQVFARWFDEPHPTHPAIVDFVLNPPEGGAGAGRCPVCRLPTRTLDARPERLTPAAVREIQARHPSWRTAQGICPQCAELFLARCRAE